MEFVRKFERQCSSQASVKRLRVHPSYTSFHNKWNLPVYFQLRCILYIIIQLIDYTVYVTLVCRLCCLATSECKSIDSCFERPPSKGKGSLLADAHNFAKRKREREVQTAASFSPPHSWPTIVLGESSRNNQL